MRCAHTGVCPLGAVCELHLQRGADFIRQLNAMLRIVRDRGLNHLQPRRREKEKKVRKCRKIPYVLRNPTFALGVLNGIYAKILQQHRKKGEIILFLRFFPAEFSVAGLFLVD